MFQKIGCAILFLFAVGFATEKLHPITPPTTSFATQGTMELDEDVYSADMDVSLEFAPHSRISFYLDGTFRFLSYSYEYSTKGYIHNYCNLHVNGFNETYAGIKWLMTRYLGMNIG